MARVVALPLLIGAIAALAACDATGSLLSPEAAPSALASIAPANPGIGNGPPFLACTPQPYASGSKVIGPAGGHLDIGLHRLTVPAGALTQPTLISGEAPSSEIASVVFAPHGLQFRVPATVAIDYRHCRKPGKPTETVAYVDAEMNVLAWPETTIVGFRALARIGHFSIYAMSSGRSQVH